ncbi:MAG TPA: hypothetical protein PLO44_02350 [Candidatus Paceibacterota bacterium]|nr:hypothetical protein [Candidatus Paceibacterota bacterium]
MKKSKISLLIFSLAGFLFSGYMSNIKIFSNTCAFGETCPLFLGIPACYYGFTIFTLILIFSIIFAFKKASIGSITNSIFYTALVGVFFSGYFAMQEFPMLLKNGFSTYKFGLPTCIMGFLFFVIIFIISIFLKKEIKNQKIILE